MTGCSGHYRPPRFLCFGPYRPATLRPVANNLVVPPYDQAAHENLDLDILKRTPHRPNGTSEGAPRVLHQVQTPDDVRVAQPREHAEKIRVDLGNSIDTGPVHRTYGN